MTFSFSLLAPNAASNVTMQAGRSGNSYTSDAYGVLKLVTPQDAFDLVEGGALNLGQQQAVNNFAGTIAPTAANDITQDYGVGSRWLIPSLSKEYVCFANTLANAVWVNLASV